MKRFLFLLCALTASLCHIFAADYNDETVLEIRIVFFVRHRDAADFENGFIVIIRRRDGGKQSVKRAEQKKKAFHSPIIGKTQEKIYRIGKRT